VAKAKKKKKKVIIVLGYEVDWIFPEGKSKRYIPTANIPDFVNFVEKTVSRYKGRVDAWQVWNEPNFAHFWKGTRDEYLKLTNAASAKIKEIDPDALLLMGGFNLLGYKSYLKGLFTTGAMELGGDISFHPYNLNPNWAIGSYKGLQKQLKKYNYKGNIVITEVGFPTGGWYPNAVKEKKYGAYIVKIMTLLAVNNAKIACWYQLFDPDKEKREKFNSEDFFGLAFRNYEKKQGAEAYPATVKNIVGKTYIPAYSSVVKFPKNLKTFYFEGADNTRTLIVWKKNYGSKKLQLSLDGKNCKIFDAKTENKFSINNNQKIKVTKYPLIITWEK
jgi:hypothetical protein